jgi:hypothetical protein
LAVVAVWMVYDTASAPAASTSCGFVFADITAREGRRSGKRGPPPPATAPVRDLLPPGALPRRGSHADTGDAVRSRVARKALDPRVRRGLTHGLPSPGQPTDTPYV